MIVREIEQTPDEELDWTIDWSKRGLGTDIITASVWTIDDDALPPDVTMNNFSFSDSTTTMWLTGGIPGKIYNITNSITTSGGREMQETVPYSCIQPRIL